jgi:hypothetical protein
MAGEAVMVGEADEGAVAESSVSRWNGDRRQPEETVMMATQISTMTVRRILRSCDIGRPLDSIRDDSRG